MTTTEKPAAESDASDVELDAGAIPDAALLSLDDFDRSCTLNSECWLELDPTCENTSSHCRGTPMRVDEVERYMQELLRQWNVPGCRIEDAGPKACAQLLAICENNRCIAVPNASELNSQLYDKSCTTADDCAAVEVERCSCTECFENAIAKSALAQFNADYAAAPACGVRGPCSGPAECKGVDLHCIQGKCELIDSRRGE